MAKRIEDLPVYEHALKFCHLINEILERPALCRNRKLWNQIAEANDSILSNMKEGFELSSDEAFANMLTYAKGSTAEVVVRIFQAFRKQYVTAEEYTVRQHMGEELQRMLGGFIKYLRRSGFKDRGSFRSKHPDKVLPPPPPRSSGPQTDEHVDADKRTPPDPAS